MVGIVPSVILAMALLVSGMAAAQELGLGIGQGDGKSLPVNISADNGIEWRQSEHVYIAHGNVKAVRGGVTVYGDEMRAFYRPVAKKPGAKPRAKAAAPPSPPMPARPAKSSGKTDVGQNLDEGATEIYRLEATGDVRFVTATQTAFGDRAVYDVDKTLLVLTGQHLKVVSPHDTLTARDSIEWYDGKQLGVARGDAVDFHDGKRIAGDVLMATLIHPPGQDAHIDRVDAAGHVFVASQDQIGRGDAGVYNAETGIVTLSGHVRLTRHENELRGEYGVVDLNRNIGHLLPRPPGTAIAAGSRLRVEGLIMPEEKTGKPGTPANRDSKTKSVRPKLEVQPAS